MAKVIGIEKEVEKDKFGKTCLENDEQIITTDDIREGWEILKNKLDNVIEDLKQSPYYLKIKNEN